MLGLSVLLAFLIQTGLVGALPNAVRATDAPEFIGAKRTVCGDIASTRTSTAKSDPTRIDLDRRFPSQPISIVIESGVRRRLGVFADRLMRQKFICVEGTIERVRGAVQIQLTQPDQVIAVGAMPPDPQFAEGMPRCTSPGITLPQIKARPNPRYTPAAMVAKLAGEVTLDVVVTTKGTVGGVQVAKSLDSLLGLDDAAVDAGRRWTFRPGTRGGQPVACVATLVMTFNLR